MLRERLSAKGSILQLCCILEKPVENAPLVLIIDPQTKVGHFE